ncbi:hypothetical protein [Rhizobium sp. SL86]|uniref:hypothetical protein n=1 Tax=Rhizobium sp. SL86 TaxID=2995148 RepID=UPI002275CFCE|nr:hypothetical protein [Rhizobium sp. SL86]MCY1669077.1 hypothetical protein [Rhizobium sp. SL86]
MTDWRPMEREPDPLKAALLDYLRDRAGLVMTRPNQGAYPLGMAQVVLADASRIGIDLSLTLEEETGYGGRPALVFAVTGQAADTRAGHAVTGKAIIDVETRSFLFLDVSLRSVLRDPLGAR